MVFPRTLPCIVLSLLPSLAGAAVLPSDAEIRGKLAEWGGAEHDYSNLGYWLLGEALSMAWDPKRRAGVVVLSNQVAGVGDVARHLLRPDLPLPKAEVVAKRVEIALDASVLDAYAGRYEAPGEGIFVVEREGTFLTIQLPPEWGLPKLRLRPESRQGFFVSELPLRVTFQEKRMLVHPPRGQKAVPADRIESVNRKPPPGVW